MRTTKKWSTLVLVGMLGMVLAFGSLTGCASMVGGQTPTALVGLFSSKLPEEMQPILIDSYKVWFGVFAAPETKVRFESKLKGLQENKDYYVVVTSALFFSTISAIRR